MVRFIVKKVKEFLQSQNNGEMIQLVWRLRYPDPAASATVANGGSCSGTSANLGRSLIDNGSPAFVMETLALTLTRSHTHRSCFSSD